MSNGTTSGVPTRSREYIEWGEKKRVHHISSVAARKPWYGLPVTTGPLAFGCKITRTARTLLNPDGCQLDKAFYGITTDRSRL